MKRTFLFISIPLSVLPLISVVSCGSSSTEYYVMPWTVDEEKINEIKKGDWQSFNDEILSLDKLKKVIKNKEYTVENNKKIYYIDRYTKEAFENDWFEKIAFDKDKDNKPGRLIIKMKSINIVNQKEIKNPYRFSNGKLEINY